MPGRDYKNEYKEYHSKPEQREKNNARKRARYALEKGGVVSKGDGKDIDHKDGNPMNNKRSNLKVTSKAANRSFPRTKTARKK
jgi:hypothetical protein